MLFDATGFRTARWSTGDFRCHSEALLDTAVEKHTCFWTSEAAECRTHSQ